MIFIKKKRVYLDYGSATPIDSRVLKLMSSYEKSFFANANSIHKDGLLARNIIEESRKNIASLLNAHSDEIIFTGSSTESNAIVIIGVVNNFKLNNKGKIPHLITTEIEHPAVLMNFKLLEEREDAEVTYLNVDKDGLINLQELKESIKENTALVSIMYANNEIGTIEPIQEISKIIRYFRKNKNIKTPLFHTDATQAMNYLFTSNIEKLGVDLLSFNGSKIYGPKGVGVLYKKRGVKISPIYAGGEQEFGLRSGTENVASIAGLSLALKITNEIKDNEVKRLTKLRDYVFSKIEELNKSNEFKIIINGDIKNRLPNNINISIEGISSELLVIELDAKGIEVSSKSACKSGEEDSYVIDAIRRERGSKSKEEGFLRITLGRGTTKKDFDIFWESIIQILTKYSKWKKD